MDRPLTTMDRPLVTMERPLTTDVVLNVLGGWTFERTVVDVVASSGDVDPDVSNFAMTLAMLPWRRAGDVNSLVIVRKLSLGELCSTSSLQNKYDESS